MNTPEPFLEGPLAVESGSGSPALAGGPLPGSAEQPPSGNTGGKFPRSRYDFVDSETGEHKILCPRGEKKGFKLVTLSDQPVHPYSAITDWLTCTFQCDGRPDTLGSVFQVLFSLLSDKFAPAIEAGRGLHGYKRSFTLGGSGALFAVGGQNGTAMLSLPGETCSLIEDWQSVVNYLSGHLNAKITRWDGAVDDYLGIHSIDVAVQMWRDDLFTTGGNRPSINQLGNWIEPDGKGRTFALGKRANGKCERIYEKGQQLGALWHPWVRWEVELHNVDRVIPWEVLLKPGHYFVGAYRKAHAWVQNEMTPIRTIQKQMQISYEHLVECAKNAYGPLLNVMAQVEGSPEAVIKKLIRAGAPRRLSHPYPDDPAEMIE